MKVDSSSLTLLITSTAIAVTILLLYTSRPKSGFGARYIIGLPLILLDLAAWVLTFGPLVTAYKMATARHVFAAKFSSERINGEGEEPSAVWRSVEAIQAGKLAVSYAAPSTTRPMLTILSISYHTPHLVCLP